MAIKVNYDGLASDVSTLTTNVKSICDSLDTLNSVENIIPGSWTSPASVKYRSTVESDLVSRVADLEGSLTGLIKMLVSISDSFNNLEGVIGNDLKSWYDGLNNNGKVLDILSNGLPTILNPSTNYDLTSLLNNPTTTSDPTAYDPSIPTQPTPTGGGGGTPSSPSSPSTPSQPVAPSEPTTPSQPAAPSEPTTPSQPTTPSDGFNSNDYDFVDNSGNTAISFDDDVSVSSNMTNSSTASGSNDNLDLSFTDDEGKTTIHFD